MDIEPTTPEQNTYTFTVECKSGETKTTTFEAANFSEARVKLADFVDQN
jgi:hypothetical protein